MTTQDLKESGCLCKGTPVRGGSMTLGYKKASKRHTKKGNIIEEIAFLSP